jgi:hypothetical protein
MVAGKPAVGIGAEHDVEISGEQLRQGDNDPYNEASVGFTLSRDQSRF